MILCVWFGVYKRGRATINEWETKIWITRDGIYCAVYLITWGIGLMWMFINGWASETITLRGKKSKKIVWLKVMLDNKFNLNTPSCEICK